jgi:sarcosine oxidase subunit alpha
MAYKDEYEIVVLGSGPSGISAALTVAQSDTKVLLIEQDETIGGHLAFHDRELVGPNWSENPITGEQWCRLKYKELVETGVDLRLNTKIEKITNNGDIYLYNKDPIITSSFIIAALGSSYNIDFFDGCDLNGVITIQTAQKILNKFQHQLRSPVCILGSNSASFDIGLTYLERNNDLNITIIDEKDRNFADPKKVKLFIEKGGTILLNTQLISAIGNTNIQLIKINNRSKNQPRINRLIPVSTLVLSPWRKPSISILSESGCKITHCSILGGELPIHDQNFCTTNPRIYAAGDLIGVENGSVAIEQGIIAGLMCLKALGKTHNNHDVLLFNARKMMKLLHCDGFSLEREKIREKIILANQITDFKQKVHTI